MTKAITQLKLFQIFHYTFPRHHPFSTYAWISINQSYTRIRHVTNPSHTSADATRRDVPKMFSRIFARQMAGAWPGWHIAAWAAHTLPESGVGMPGFPRWNAFTLIAGGRCLSNCYYYKHCHQMNEKQRCKWSSRGQSKETYKTTTTILAPTYNLK